MKNLEKERARRRRWRETSPVYVQKQKEYHWKKHGIRNADGSLFLFTDFEALLEAQAGLCAVCKTAPIKRKLDVDHDHTTGFVRGLLCPVCNRNRVGNIESDTKLFMAALRYLKYWREQHSPFKTV